MNGKHPHCECSAFRRAQDIFLIICALAIRNPKIVISVARSSGVLLKIDITKTTNSFYVCQLNTYLYVPKNWLSIESMITVTVNLCLSYTFIYVRFHLFSNSFIVWPSKLYFSEQINPDISGVERKKWFYSNSGSLQ